MVRTELCSSQVEAPTTKKTGSSSATTPAGASAVTADKTDKPAEEAPPGDTSGRDSSAKPTEKAPTEKAPPGDTNGGRDSTTDDERAAFQRLQASVAEDAQVCEHCCCIISVFSSACK